MRFMVIIKATEDSEQGIMPSAELLEEMTAYNEQLAAAGVLVAGEGLHPSSTGARVYFNGNERTVARGPFPETTQLVAGFWIFEVESLEQAVDWVRRCPNPMPGEAEVEIRQVFLADDFGDAMTPDLRDREERLREETATLS